MPSQHVTWNRGLLLKVVLPPWLQAPCPCLEPFPPCRAFRLPCYPHPVPPLSFQTQPPPAEPDAVPLRCFHPVSSPGRQLKLCSPHPTRVRDSAVWEILSLGHL